MQRLLIAIQQGTSHLVIEFPREVSWIATQRKSTPDITCPLRTHRCIFAMLLRLQQIYKVTLYRAAQAFASRRHYTLT
jgi:hypothetical protein